MKTLFYFLAVCCAVVMIMKKSYFLLVLVLSALFFSCSNDEELIVNPVADPYSVNVTGISLGDTLKLLFDGEEVSRGLQGNNNTIDFSKQLLFKEGTVRLFELRTVKTDSLVASFSPNTETKEDFDYAFMYYPDLGGLITGLEMPAPAEGMMNFEFQLNTSISGYNEPLDLVFEYIEYKTDGSVVNTPIETITGYVPGSGFTEPIEIRPPKFEESPWVPGLMIQAEYINVHCYKSGTTEYYSPFLWGSVSFLPVENLDSEGDQDWIIVNEQGDESYYWFDTTYLEYYLREE